MRALVAGLQGGPELNPGSVLATVKHWPGEGAGGEAGITYDEVTIKYHMIPWRAAIDAGAVNIMPGYAGSEYLDPGGPGAGNTAPILRYLRDELGYTGLITTDWLPSSAWVSAANAGSDVVGGADPGASGFSMAEFTSQVPIGRIDDAVTRVPRLKFELGVFDRPYGDPVNGPYRFHQPSYAALANQAARDVVVVMTLPRPTVISEWNGLADAIVMTYRGGEEVGPATASLLFGDYEPRGRLPWQLPRSVDQILKPGGIDRPEDAVEDWNIPYDLGATPAERADIRAHIDTGRPPPTGYGDPLYPYGAGIQGWP